MTTLILTGTGEDPEPGTAGWLHDQLSSQPRDRKIIMARDAEGNGYSGDDSAL